MPNYKLLIQYDGTDFAGWQIQENASTIQQTIMDSIEILLKEKVNLIGSGRTDTGVHALGQIANFKTEKEINLYKFKHSLNAILSNNIAIPEIKEVQETFHSRFDAIKRSYLYFIAKEKSPFYYQYSYRYNGILDINYLNNISKILIGNHDFTSFSKVNSEPLNKNCLVYNIHWKETKDFIIFFVEANRFLHGMVRTIVGTIIKSFRENLDENYILELLDKKDRTLAGNSVPAKGLFLYKVKY